MLSRRALVTSASVDVQALALLAGSVLAYGLVSRRAETSILTPPMAAAALGLACGPAALDVVNVRLDRALIATLAEVTLVVALFTDAARIDVRQLRRDHHLPLRLLGAGLPLAIICGTGLAVLLLPSLSLWEAAILATILAPTDAALGQAVVNDTRVPQRVRQALNVESGLNDGLALPALLFFIAAMGSKAQQAQDWVGFAVLQLGAGPLLGAVIGYGGGKLVQLAQERQWMNEVFRQIALLALSVFAFGLAEVLGANGFLAAFTAGVALGALGREAVEPVHRFGEAEGQLLSLATFFIFGATLLPAAFDSIDARELTYAVASLTVVRLLAVALSMLGSRTRATTWWFVGWFGPRGLASIIYLLLLHEHGLTRLHGVLFDVVIATVALSMVAHGLTAAPFARAYGQRMQRRGHAQAPTEHAPAHNFPLRVPWKGRGT